MATLHRVTREFAPQQPRPSTAEEEENPPASLPMYLAGLIVTLCGLFAISLILDDVGFSNLTMGLAIIGTTVSYLSRKQNIDSLAVWSCWKWRFSGSPRRLLPGST